MFAAMRTWFRRATAPLLQLNAYLLPDVRYVIDGCRARMRCAAPRNS